MSKQGMGNGLVTFLGVVSILMMCTQACIRRKSSDSKVKRAWGKQDDPGILGINAAQFHYKKNLPARVFLDKKPWTSDYWPFWRGGIGFRWQHYDPNQKREDAIDYVNEARWKDLRYDVLPVALIRVLTNKTRVYYEIDDHWYPYQGFVDNFEIIKSHNDRVYGKKNNLWREVFLRLPEDVDQVYAVDIASLSPAEKYDLLVGDEKWTVTRRTDGPSTSKIKKWSRPELWTGHCDGWAPASIHEPMPGEQVVLESPKGLKIQFFREDIKALLAFAWLNNIGDRAAVVGDKTHDAIRFRKAYPHDGIVMSVADVRRQRLFDSKRNQMSFTEWQSLRLKFLKVGNDDTLVKASRGPQTGTYILRKRYLDGGEETHDFTAGAFHILMGRYFAAKKKHVMIDRAISKSIWNQPVYGYEVGYGEPSYFYRSYDDYNEEGFKYWVPKLKKAGKLGWRASAKTRKLVEVTMKLFFSAEYPYPSRTVIPSVPVQKENVVLRYFLELDNSDNVVGGEWVSRTIPDFMWVSTHNEPHEQSSYLPRGKRDYKKRSIIKYSVVKKILNASLEAK